MSSKDRGLSILGGLLFAAGALIGLIFFGSAVWADFEAFLFSPGTGATSPLTSLACPLLITSTESGEVSVKINNSEDREVRRRVRFYATDGFVTLMRESTQSVDIPANQSGSVQFPVYPQNAVYGRFVLVRAYQFALYPIPAQTGACGVIVYSLAGLSGHQIVSLAVAFSGLFMASGLALWANADQTGLGRRRSLTNGMRGLTLIIFAGIITSLLGWWMVGAVLLLLTVLLTVILLGLAISS